MSEREVWEKEVWEEVEEGRKEGRELRLRCEVGDRAVRYWKIGKLGKGREENEEGEGMGERAFLGGSRRR